jgi:hypothetical protein
MRAGDLPFPGALLPQKPLPFTVVQAGTAYKVVDDPETEHCHLLFLLFRHQKLLSW